VGAEKQQAQGPGYVSKRQRKHPSDGGYHDLQPAEKHRAFRAALDPYEEATCERGPGSEIVSGASSPGASGLRSGKTYTEQAPPCCFWSCPDMRIRMLSQRQPRNVRNVTEDELPSHHPEM
jgi:hypothetical protein